MKHLWRAVPRKWFTDWREHRRVDETSWRCPFSISLYSEGRKCLALSSCIVLPSFNFLFRNKGNYILRNSSSVEKCLQTTIVWELTTCLMKKRHRRRGKTLLPKETLRPSCAQLNGATENLFLEMPSWLIKGDRMRFQPDIFVSIADQLSQPFQISTNMWVHPCSFSVSSFDFIISFIYNYGMFLISLT